MLARAPESSRAPRSPETDDRTPRPDTVNRPGAPDRPAGRAPAPAGASAHHPDRVQRSGYSRWVFGVLAPVLAIVVFAGGVAVGNSGALAGGPGPNGGQTAGPGNGGAAADLALIQEAWKAIQDNYVDAQHLDDRDLAYGAIRGMTEAVGDEGHTSFLTADEAKAVDQSLSGTFVGIGVQLDEDESKGPIIRSIIPGTPAEEAGLRRGDLIVAVDGEKTDGETIDEVVSQGPRTRGRAGHPHRSSATRASRSTSPSPASSSTCRW